MTKKILFSIFSAWLLYYSYVFYEAILSGLGKIQTWNEFLFISAVLNLVVLGVFAMIGFVFPTHKLLPSRYYSINNPKRLTHVYRLFGVKYFRFLLMLFFWGRKKNRNKYFDGTRTGLKNLIYQSKQSEFGHLAALVSIGLLSLPLIISRQLELVALISLINVLVNFYPVILQRHHRMRVDRVNKIRNLP